ncbi:hypothetical protein PAPYR_10238 [Paratrimastix pyriformis]|uniref:Uncharacterized protein n=1 Tax=Paratrimastix pyriformis TaxID=342808 RepID=A0ABQ8U872_9EUKA|nr:hypothetical protein PAPYR_10238 [Paratrimastix pyriformis]
MGNLTVDSAADSRCIFALRDPAAAERLLMLSWYGWCRATWKLFAFLQVRDLISVWARIVRCAMSGFA